MAEEDGHEVMEELVQQLNYDERLHGGGSVARSITKIQLVHQGSVHSDGGGGQARAHEVAASRRVWHDGDVEPPQQRQLL